jgi:hypothetical protein
MHYDIKNKGKYNNKECCLEESLETGKIGNWKIYFTGKSGP